jgi:lysophospholipase L1-like esterase
MRAFDSVKNPGITLPIKGEFSSINRMDPELVGMRLPPNYGKPYLTQFHQLFPSLAEHYHTALLPFMLEGVAADQFQTDNLHPNTAAQPQIPGNILRPLKPLLHQGT